MWYFKEILAASGIHNYNSYSVKDKNIRNADNLPDI